MTYVWFSVHTGTHTTRGRTDTPTHLGPLALRALVALLEVLVAQRGASGARPLAIGALLAPLAVVQHRRVAGADGQRPQRRGGGGAACAREGGQEQALGAGDQNMKVHLFWCTTKHTSASS